MVLQEQLLKSESQPIIPHLSQQHQMFNLIHKNSMELRTFRHVASVYMKILHLQKQVDELTSTIIFLGSYPENYQSLIDSINHSLEELSEKLEFKYK